MNIFSGKGRIGRLQFLGWMVALWPLVLLIKIVYWEQACFGLIPVLVLLLALYVLSWAPILRRLHDINQGQEAFWAAMILPFGYVVVFLGLLFWKGTTGANRYGEEPLARKGRRSAHDLMAGTNREDTPSDTKKSDDVNTDNSSLREESTSMNDDAFYDEVAKELETNTLVPGVWTRAFAEADGDENRAKAIYIKRRVVKLVEERSLKEKRSTEDASEEKFKEWLESEKGIDAAETESSEQGEELTVGEKAKAYIVLAVILIVIIIAGVYSATSH